MLIHANISTKVALQLNVGANHQWLLDIVSLNSETQGVY